MLGSNWTHNFETRLELVRPGNAPGWASLYCTDFWPHATCAIRHDEHSSQLFIFDPVSSRFVPHLGTSSAHIVHKADVGYVLYERGGHVERYNLDGYLTESTDRFGNGYKVELELTPLAALQERYCYRKRTGDDVVDALQILGMEPVVCAYLGFALGEQPAQPLSREGLSADQLLPLPEMNSSPMEWERFTHETPDTESDREILISPSEYKVMIRRANMYLRNLMRLGYMVKPAHGESRWRVKRVVENRHGRTFDFHYNEQFPSPTPTPSKFGLLENVTVNSPSHDPLEYIDSYNLYAFATLDPINFLDPWGLDAKGLAASCCCRGKSWMREVGRSSSEAMDILRMWVRRLLRKWRYLSPWSVRKVRV